MEVLAIFVLLRCLVVLSVLMLQLVLTVIQYISSILYLVVASFAKHR